MIQIVVLDGYTLNPGDLSWEELSKLGHVTIYENTKKEEIINRSIDAHIILTNKTPLTEQILDNLPKLRYIGVLATGYDVVDVSAASKRNIKVTNVPQYSSQTVSQFVFALILELAHHVYKHHESVVSKDWCNSEHFSYTLSSQIELANRTLGIVGYGQIGRQVAIIAQAFGMKVIVSGRNQNGHETNEDGIERVSLDHLLSVSDIVTLHCPLTDQTKHLINKDSLSKMKSTAWLINTARGGLVHEEDLANALNNDVIAGAALDVLSQEPPDESNPLLGANHCIITPHIAWSSKEARQRLYNIAVQNIISFNEGKYLNLVN